MPSIARLIMNPFNDISELEQIIIESDGGDISRNMPSGLFKEFLLYGFVKASGQKFQIDGTAGYIEKKSEKKGKFEIKENLIAVSDFSGDLWIRPNKIYSEIDCIIGTLLNSGFVSGSLSSPHLQGDTFSDPHSEELFESLGYFSERATSLTGSEPYPKRDINLKPIFFAGKIFIPGKYGKT